MVRNWKESIPISKRNLVLGYSTLRSLTYFSEGFPLFMATRLQQLLGRKGEPPKEFQQAVLREAQDLLKNDSEHIARGEFPLAVLRPEVPWQHFPRLARIFADGLRIGWRRYRRKNKSFGEESQKWLSELPDYYKRNFHYQTDGYLSEHSADLYDHQVEILFRGVAGAMRRLVLPPLIEHFRSQRTERPKLLELGSGPGSSTQYVLQTLPDVRVTCLDLSQPYLKKAQQRLKDYDRVNFLQGDAAQLPFKDETYAGIFSVFLFHELPYEVRQQVLMEAWRVLQPGGLFVVVDSLQKDDTPELNWGLEQFPRDYHEPFYKNYIENPLEEQFRTAGFEAIGVNKGFYSKAIWGFKRSPTLSQA